MDIIICEYISEEEANDLINRLKDISVDAYSKSSGKSPNTYSNIFISEKDLNAAMPVVKKYLNKLKVKTDYKKMICPNCKSVPPDTYHKKDLSFFQKLYTIGTSVIICKKCFKKWYV